MVLEYLFMDRCCFRSSEPRLDARDEQELGKMECTRLNRHEQSTDETASALNITTMYKSSLGYMKVHYRIHNA